MWMFDINKKTAIDSGCICRRHARSLNFYHAIWLTEKNLSAYCMDT